jgi:hypothetical protein
MYFNDSFILNGAGGSVVLVSPLGDRLLYYIQLHFCATNIVAEYEALGNIAHHHRARDTMTLHQGRFRARHQPSNGRFKLLRLPHGSLSVGGKAIRGEIRWF